MDSLEGRIVKKTSYHVDANNLSDKQNDFSPVCFFVWGWEGCELWTQRDGMRDSKVGLVLQAGLHK